MCGAPYEAELTIYEAQETIFFQLTQICKRNNRHEMWNLTVFQYLALLGRAMRTPGVAPQQFGSKQAKIGSLQAPRGKHHFCCRYNEI